MQTLDVPLIHLFGRVAMTETAEATLAGEDLAAAIFRHRRSFPDHREGRATTENVATLFGACRILSVHRARTGTPFWIITEADGSLSILLPADYGALGIEPGAGSNRFEHPANSPSLSVHRLRPGKPS